MDPNHALLISPILFSMTVTDPRVVMSSLMHMKFCFSTRTNWNRHCHQGSHRCLNIKNMVTAYYKSASIWKVSWHLSSWSLKTELRWSHGETPSKPLVIILMFEIWYCYRKLYADNLKHINALSCLGNSTLFRCPACQLCALYSSKSFSVSGLAWRILPKWVVS